MSRRTLPAVFLAASLGLLASGCASTTTPALPPGSLALLEVSWTDGRFDASGVVPGEEAATSQLGRALLRELARKGPVADARGQQVRPADLGRDAAKTAALRAAAPADFYLAVRVITCGAWPASSQDGGTSAAWYAGECTAELKALDPEGKTVAALQKTGRWDSPRRERLEGKRMQAEAVSRAVDATAERLAYDLRPAAAK
jgi:hypothetical protein